MNTETGLRKYRLVRGAIGREESGEVKLYKAKKEGSDVLELTPAQAAKYGDRVQLIGEGQYEPVTDPGMLTIVGGEPVKKAGEGEVLTGPPPGSTAPELKELAKTEGEGGEGKEGEGEKGKTSDSTTQDEWSFLSDLNVTEAASTITSLETMEDVVAAMEAEKAGSNRKGVLKAGESRKEELTKQRDEANA